MVFVAVVLVLLIGTTVGYELGTGVQRTSTTTVTFLMTTTLTTTALPPQFNASEEIQSACNYLESNYNPQMGLISVTPGQGQYFLYSDNYLATLVLSGTCKDPTLANSMNGTLDQPQDSPSNIPNQYMVLGCKGPYFDGSKDYDLSGEVWTTINNQPGAPLNDSYADIAFLQAYYDKACTGNTSAAQTAFDAGAEAFNGIGITDIVYSSPQSSSYHQYQTYKLALYVYTATLLGQKVPLSALVNLIRMQSTSGGFYTGYDASYSDDGTLTNTETTCLAIMALQAAIG